MPTAAPKPCVFPGCRNLGHCPEHDPQRYRQRNRARIARSPWQGFYSTNAWTKTRNATLRREPACRRCGRPAAIVDHIVPLSEGGAQTDPENLQPLCKGCHNRKTDEDKQRRSNVDIATR